MSDQEIKDLKDGVPNYPMPEVQGPVPSHEHLCGECTGSGIMLGFYPCKVCGGNGYIIPNSPGKTETVVIDSSTKSEHSYLVEEAWPKYSFTELRKMLTEYPNERELSLLNNRIATLKAQLSKELQKKKSERSQRDINQLQQSINTLTKWKTQKK